MLIDAGACGSEALSLDAGTTFIRLDKFMDTIISIFFIFIYMNNKLLGKKWC